jgi:hypothetical protein
MKSFTEIFMKCDTDKAQYHDAYEDCFSNTREDVELLFEIGVCRGGSVRGFREYFSNALIVGIDIDPLCYFEEDRIEIEIGDATKKEYIDSLIMKYGRPDIVIDDGSHFSKDIKESFELLYPHVCICYVIEDCGKQYREFRNGFYINDGIPATTIIHNKIDELLFNKNICKRIYINHSICMVFK